jgi:hypothetical protein
MPRREFELTIGATIQGKCVQAKTATDWLRDEDKLIYDCVQQLGAPPAIAGRFNLDDDRP